MRVWRLTRPAFERTALSGEGASLWGGRWNSRGRPVVYRAGSPALAILESFVHLPGDQRRPEALPLMILLTIDIPDDEPIGTMTAARPRYTSGEEVSRTWGDGWLARGENLALRVDSAVVPQEVNILLNPRHPAMSRVAIVARDEYRFDRRLAEAP